MRILLFAALALFLLICAYEARVYLGALALCRPSRAPIAATLRDEAHAKLPGLEDVAFSTKDDVTIRGWYTPPANGVVIVMGTGLGQNRTFFLPDAEMLAARGYGSLLIDWRAHGESGGETSTLGDKEQLDFEAAVDFVAARPEVRKDGIAGAGFSIGASTVAMEASRDPRVRAVVLLAVWSSMTDEIRYKSRHLGPLSDWPALGGLRHGGVVPEDVHPIDVLQEMSPRPILFIGGTRDSDTPPWVMEKVFAAAREPKRIWFAPDAGHGEFRLVAPNTYDRTVLDFLDGAFGIAGVGRSR